MLNIAKKLLSVLFLLLQLESYAQGVKFENGSDWKQILAKARSENKYVFVDCYATWCGPCKAMDRDVYPDEAVGRNVNDKFIAVKMQMDTSDKDDQAIKNGYASSHFLMAEYKVLAFPTFLFFSPDGTLVHRGVGYKKSEDFLDMSDAALNPDKQFYSVLNRYKSGKLTPKECGDFANAATHLGEKQLGTEAAHVYMDKYLFTLKDKELFASKDNLDFIETYANSTTDKGFKLFWKDSAKINSLLGANVAQKKCIMLIVTSDVIPLVEKTKGTPDWTAIEKQETKKYGNLGKIATLQERLIRTYNLKDWEAFGVAYKAYYENVGEFNVFYVNGFAWDLFEHTNDQSVLLVAMKVMARYKNKENPEEVDTYANLLYKTGQKDQAIEWEQKAVELDKQRAAARHKEQGPEYPQTLEKMKTGQPTWPNN